MITHVNMGTFVPEEMCRVPANAVIVQMKYCELCGVPFPRRYSPTVLTPVVEEEHVQILGRPNGRGLAQWAFVKTKRDIRRDSGERLCRSCHARPSLEVSAEELLKKQEDYKAQLPNLDSIHASIHPIRYDRPIVGRQTSAHRLNGTITVKSRRMPRAQMLLEADAWRARVTAAFREKGRLALDQIQDLIPRCYTPVAAYGRCYAFWGTKLKAVGYGPSEGFRGRPMRIYVLDGVSPETL